MGTQGPYTSRAATTGAAKTSPRLRCECVPARAWLSYELGHALEARNGDGDRREAAAVLRLVAAGRTNKEIAHELGISLKTVETHTHRIYEKTGTQNRTEAALYAVRAGIAT